MKLTRSLRLECQRVLGQRLRVNDCIRSYLKTNPSFDSLISYIRKHKNHKRSSIPANMHYNRWVKAYWKQNPKGTHSECVDLWHTRYKRLFYQGLDNDYHQVEQDT